MFIIYYNYSVIFSDIKEKKLDEKNRASSIKREANTENNKSEHFHMNAKN